MKYFEDFRVGDRHRSAEYTVTEREIIEFARQFDPQPMHTIPGNGLIASGWHTAAIVMRLRLASGFEIAGGMMGMGVDQMRWPQPVRPGDTLHVETEILETRQSQSKPDFGIVRVRESAINQRGEIVMMMETALWVPVRGK
jgi:acyl dehydratase